MVNESDEEAELVRQSRVLREEMTEQLKQTLITTVAEMIKTSIDMILGVRITSLTTLQRIVMMKQDVD